MTVGFNSHFEKKEKNNRGSIFEACFECKILIRALIRQIKGNRTISIFLNKHFRDNYEVFITIFIVIFMFDTPIVTILFTKDYVKYWKKFDSLPFRL